MKKLLLLSAITLTIISCKKESVNTPTEPTKKVISIQLISTDKSGTQKIEN